MQFLATMGNTSVKILEIQKVTESKKHRTFEFKIKVQFKNWEEPTNKQGLETLLINVSSFGTSVEEYIHKDVG